jgi:hypothetical protein
MSDKDFLDHAFDSMEKITKWLYEKDLIKNWFNFVGWTFMTAVAFGLAKLSNSKVIFLVASVSVILLFFYGWHSTQEVVKSFLQDNERKSGRIIVLSLALATIVPVILIFYIISAVSAYIATIL